MSRRRALLTAASGGSIPTEGLVFHASFRRSLTAAETGQTLRPTGEAELVEDGGRMVMRLNAGCLKFSADGLPVDNAPFTIAVKAKFAYARGGFLAFGWGAPGQVAALSFNEIGIGFHDWGDANTGQFADVTDWRHYAAACDGERVVFYVDGEVNAAQVVAGVYPGDDTGSFGCWWSEGGDGDRFANARIYDRALSAAEVAALAREE